MFESLISLLLSLLLIITIFIVLSNNLLMSSIFMSIFSAIIALTYLMMNAPDVAITEASVGAGLSTVFTFAALSLIKDYQARFLFNPTKLFLMSCLAVFILYFMYDLPDFGDYNAYIHQHVAPYYIEQTQEAINIPNVVTAILASFRGYDTFGETVVVFTAALCITLILQKRKND